MAMNLRLPEEIDAKAKQLAVVEHRSLHSFVVNAVDDYIRRNEMKEAVRQSAINGAKRYRKALDELGDS